MCVILSFIAVVVSPVVAADKYYGSIIVVYHAKLICVLSNFSGLLCVNLTQYTKPVNDILSVKMPQQWRVGSLSIQKKSF